MNILSVWPKLLECPLFKQLNSFPRSNLFLHLRLSDKYSSELVN